MRTVSFSSAPVRNILDKNFVCQLINTNGDPSAGGSIGHAPGDAAGFCTRGIGKQNVQCLFLKPQGEIFHTASGYRGPEDLLDELDFAQATYRAICRQPSQAKQLVRDAHINRLKKNGFSEAVISRPASSSFIDVMQAMRNTTPQNANVRNNSRNPFDAVNRAFEIKGRGSELADGRFAIQYPMLSIEKFLQDPRLLVGHEASAFQSVGNGGASGGPIGQ